MSIELVAFDENNKTIHGRYKKWLNSAKKNRYAFSADED